MSGADTTHMLARHGLVRLLLALAYLSGAGSLTTAQAQKKVGQPGVTVKQQAQQNLKAAIRPQPAPVKAPAKARP